MPRILKRGVQRDHVGVGQRHVVAHLALHLEPGWGVDVWRAVEGMGPKGRQGSLGPGIGGEGHAHGVLMHACPSQVPEQDGTS